MDSQKLQCHLLEAGTALLMEAQAGNERTTVLVVFEPHHCSILVLKGQFWSPTTRPAMVSTDKLICHAIICTTQETARPLVDSSHPHILKIRRSVWAAMAAWQNPFSRSIVCSIKPCLFLWAPAVSPLCMQHLYLVFLQPAEDAA